MFCSTINKVSTKNGDRQLPYNYQRIAGIKNIIAISSGQDRAGKNTIAVNIAVILAQLGSKVGLIDADIHRSQASNILGLEDSPISVLNRAKLESWEPVDNFGVKLITLASLINSDSLEGWNADSCNSGLDRAIEQIISEVHWGDLDYLIINFPPGVGDVQLALAQAVPISGVVTIANHQQKTNEDIYATLKMFEQLEIPIFGLVENMGETIIAPDLPKRKYEIRGGEQQTSKIRVPYLGYIPLDDTVSQYSDRQIPIVLAEPLSIFVSALNAIVWQIAFSLNKKNTPI